MAKMKVHELAKELDINSKDIIGTLADTEYGYLYLVNIEHCYFINEKLNLSMETQIPHPHGHGGPIICNMADWTWN